LVRLKHSDFAKFLLNNVSERLQIDTDGKANHHGVFYFSRARERSLNKNWPVESEYWPLAPW